MSRESTLHPELAKLLERFVRGEGGKRDCDFPGCNQPHNLVAKFRPTTPKVLVGYYSLFFCSEEHRAIAVTRWGLANWSIDTESCRIATAVSATCENAVVWVDNTPYPIKVVVRFYLRQKPTINVVCSTESERLQELLGKDYLSLLENLAKALIPQAREHIVQATTSQ